MFGFFKKRSVKAIKTRPLSIAQKRKSANKKKYHVEMAITFDGVEINKFPMTIAAYNKAKAFHDINARVGLKILTISHTKE